MSECKRYKSSILIIVIAGIFQACSLYKPIEFQILKPSQVKIGSNNTVVNIHCEYCDKPTLVSHLDSINRDKANVSVNFLYTLKEKLQQSPLLQNAQFSLLPHDSLLMEIKKPHSRQELGLVILLDSIYLSDTLVYQKQKSSYENVAIYGVIHKFRCKTYQRKSMELIDDFLLEDTVFFPVSYYYDIIVLPDWKDAIWDTGIKAGEKYAHYLAPYWIEQQRIFYYQNKFFKKAYKYLQSDQIDSAIVTVNDGVKYFKNKNHSKAMHNLAVLYELKDEFIKALALSDSANNASPNKISKQYSEILRKRKIDRIALDWQMKE